MARIKTELKDAMRSKDSFKSTVLRVSQCKISSHPYTALNKATFGTLLKGLLSDHQYAEKAGNSSASNLASILQKAVGKRQESSRQFRAAKPAREDLAEKEDREASLIQEFLPKQIPIEELESIVNQVIQEVQKSGTSGKKIIGEVMKGVAAKVDKSRAPGSVISEVVRKLLPKE